MLAASVIVPARNAASTLPRTLHALAVQKLDGDYEVIVVDDGSDDETAAIARGAGAPVRLITQPATGPAEARNRGVRAARAARLAFCDADVFPTEGWLAAGIDALERADLVQGQVLPDPAAELGPFDRTIWITSEVGLWETANLFTTREVFDRVGGFEQWLSPLRGKALAEDVWFGYRALRSGAVGSFCADALAHHAVFTRGWTAYIGERERLQYFPAMARQMPELRSAFLYENVFLNGRSARFDLAVAAMAAAAAARSPLPLAAAVPYLRAVKRQAGRAQLARGPHPALVAAVDVLADVTGLAALAAGSARYRSLVL